MTVILNSDKTKGEMDVTPIDSTNKTTFIIISMSMFSITIMHLCYHQITKNMYPQEQNMNQQKYEFFVRKNIFWFIY